MIFWEELSLKTKKAEQFIGKILVVFCPLLVKYFWDWSNIFEKVLKIFAKKWAFGQKKWAFGHFWGTKVGRKIDEFWLKMVKKGLKMGKNRHFSGYFVVFLNFWSKTHFYF